MPSVAHEENTEENDFDRIGRELDKLEATKRVEGQAAEENTNIEENDFDKIGRELDKLEAAKRVEGGLPKSDTVSWFLYFHATSDVLFHPSPILPLYIRFRPTNLLCRTRVLLLLLLLLKMEVVIRIWR